jgi:hypothetical protein
MSMSLDPRAKSAIGLPVPHQEAIWQYMKMDLIALAISFGPPSIVQRVAAQTRASQHDDHV